MRKIVWLNFSIYYNKKVIGNKLRFLTYFFKAVKSNKLDCVSINYLHHINTL